MREDCLKERGMERRREKPEEKLLGSTFPCFEGNQVQKTVTSPLILRDS